MVIYHLNILPYLPSFVHEKIKKVRDPGQSGRVLSEMQDPLRARALSNLCRSKMKSRPIGTGR